MKELWERVRRVLDLPRLIVVLDGALDRKALEELLQKQTRGGIGRANTLARAELVGRLADFFCRDVDAAAVDMRELDRACSKERHIVASIDEAALADRLASYRALDFRRERARLVWALVRDGRDMHSAAANRILDEAFAAVDAAQRTEAALADDVAAEPAILDELKEKLSGYEAAIREQQQQLAREAGAKESVERERSELMARLGARERALRDEGELRRNQEDENRRLRGALREVEEQLAAGHVDRVRELENENQRLRERVRAFERIAERTDRLAELEAEVARLRAEAVARDSKAEGVQGEHEEQLRILQERHKAALHRVDELRGKLKEARQQLAGPKPAPSPRGETRVGVFIDDANLSASARRDLGSKLDYGALLPALVDDRRLALAVTFVVTTEEAALRHAGFVQSLRGHGYDVREKRPKVRHDGSRKADWDMGIAMEVLDALDEVDVVVLGSGDGDYMPLVKRLQREGKRVEVAAFRSSTDEALVRAADGFIGLDGRFRLAM